MNDRKLLLQHLRKFCEYLQREEKSTVTVEKYFRDVRTFLEYTNGRPVTKELTVAYKKYLEEKNIPLWIRHVVVPGVSDDPGDLRELGRFIGTLRNLKALDVLPYHTMGVNKYKELGMEYPLEGVEALPKEKAVEARKFIMEGIREVRGAK